jgi:hypothetical protein
MDIVPQGGKPIAQSIDLLECCADAGIDRFEHNSRGRRISHRCLDAACGCKLLAATRHLVYHGTIDRGRPDHRRKNRNHGYRNASGHARPAGEPAQGGSMLLLAVLLHAGTV